MDTLIQKLESWMNMALDFAPRIVMALLVLIIGWWIIGRVMRVISRQMERRNLDSEIRPFLKSLISVLLKVLLLFSIAEMVGIRTASFLAMLAALGFAIGMALQGSLGNFAAGIMILAFKPYKLGDIIQIQDYKGKVTEIQIFNTVMVTPLNRTVIVPNGVAISNVIVNDSSVGNVRVDLYASMPYDEDFAKVRDGVLALVEGHSKILKEPVASVGIESFDSHNIQFGVFVFCKPGDYWDVFYDVHEIMKKALGKHGVKMAYAEGIDQGAISPN